MPVSRPRDPQAAHHRRPRDIREPAASRPGTASAVTRLTRDLVSDVDARLAGMPAPPAEPTSLADLIAAHAPVYAAELAEGQLLLYGSSDKATPAATNVADGPQRCHGRDKLKKSAHF